MSRSRVVPDVVVSASPVPELPAAVGDEFVAAFRGYDLDPVAST